MNNIFKENTGTDMRISPDNMSDAAAALGFEIASRKNEDVKTQPNFKARSDENLKRQKEMAAISDANAMKHIAFAHSLKDKDNSPEKINNVMDNIDEVSSQIKMHDPTVKSVEIKKSLFGGMLGLDNKRIIQVNKYDEKGKLKSYTINFDPSKPKETSDAIIQAYKRHHVVTDADIKKFNETPKVTLSKSDRVNVKPIKGKKLY